MLLSAAFALLALLALGEESEVSIVVEGEKRVIRSNGLPDHATGEFPNRGNPNRISLQDYTFTMPAKPAAAEQVTPLGMNLFGVAVNGVVFDPGAAEWWNRDRNSGWQYEPLGGTNHLGMDANNAHVQPSGAYHYHGLPTALMKKLTGGQPKMALVGWAADGFPIYGPWGYSDAKNPKSAPKKLKPSYQLKPGARPDGPGGKHDGTFVEDYEYIADSGDLDECNGRFGVTPEFPEGIYHYYLTEAFPYIPRFLRGARDNSFLKRPPRGGPRLRPPNGDPTVTPLPPRRGI